jgi:penicillin-insensitive murein endopeptidase
MNGVTRGSVLLLLFLLLDPARAGNSVNPWSALDTPTEGPARAIGEPSAGCLRGGRQLSAEGPGYLLMHLERRRDWGHPALLEVIVRLGRVVLTQGLGLLHVGDLGMVRGGPMPFGHRSHQSGLDADIWFDLDPKAHQGANAERSNLKAKSFLDPLSNGVNQALWRDAHLTLLRAAAEDPAVDRIFVNARIKQQLCDQAQGQREWLRKIRPWYYHEDHFHLRLRCPEDSPSCLPQEPIPPGDGCHALDYWLSKPATPTPERKSVTPPTPTLPSECRRILHE